MKVILGSCIFALVAALQAQVAPSPSAQPGRQGPTQMEARGPTSTNAITARVGRPVKLGGAAVNAARIDNPLQLINPFAPSRYGYTKTTHSRNPLQEIQGLDLFTINF